MCFLRLQLESTKQNIYTKNNAQNSSSFQNINNLNAINITQVIVLHKINNIYILKLYITMLSKGTYGKLEKY